MFSAVLDTCVLWPSLQRDFILTMAAEGLFRPLWSEDILEELLLHEARKHVTRGDSEATAGAKAERLVITMRVAFADALVTNNVRDFPSSALPADLLVLTPSQFVLDMAVAAPVSSAHAVSTVAERFARPPMRAHEVLDGLVARYDMGEAAEVIRPHLRS